MAHRLTHRFFIFHAAGLLALMVASASTQAAEAPSLRLALPIDCVPGESCWIVNYVDHDPTTGLRDYTCGKATYNAPPGNQHKGTDIAIRDLAAMRRGVIVRAAAPGIVAGARDGMQDVSIRKLGVAAVKGKECGNGVRIIHGKGWSTQYCHMRRGSIKVKNGRKVKEGQLLGMVGLSGLTEYPHLHIQVAKGKTIVDPFVGPNPDTTCRVAGQPLWKADVLAKLPYRPTALYIAGFAGSVPNSEQARAGSYRDSVLSRTVPALVLWVDIFRVQAGDELTLTITGPNGKTVFRNTSVLKKTLTRGFRAGGKKKKGTPWEAGTYRGEITLARKRAGNRPETYSLSRQVTIR
jgi:murein DD-endopeptidase MepM/ murein hydrolase activator NlpD